MSTFRKKAMANVGKLKKEVEETGINCHITSWGLDLKISFHMVKLSSLGELSYI